MGRGLNQIKTEIRQAAKSGNAESVRPLIAEFRERLKLMQDTQASIAAERVDPTEGMSGIEKLGTGMASGLVNVGRRAGQLLTPKKYEEKLGVSDADIEEQSKTDAPLASTLPGAVGRFVTEAALTAPVGGAAGTAVKGLGNAVNLARTGRVAGLAAEGAAGGELTAGNAGEGAAWNLGLGGALGAAKRLVGGSKNVTPEARRLLDEGVDLTPGQMNPRGAVAQLEQGAERVPYLGAYVQDHRRKLIPSAMRKLFEKEFGDAVPADAGFDDMVRKTNEKLGARYDEVRAAAGGVKAGGGNQLQQEWSRAVNSPALLVSPEARQASGRWLAGQLDALKTRGNVVSAEDLLTIRSRIRDEVRKAHKTGQGPAVERAEVLELAEEAITRQVNAALPPPAQKLLQETDALYARYKPLEQAGFQSAARAGGEPTVGQLVGALKQQAGQSRWAGRGGGRNQQFLEDVRDAAETTLRPTGASLPSTVVAGGLMPLIGLGMTKTGKRLYSGRTGAQRAGQKAMSAAKATPGVRELVEILRRGSAGALADHTGER
jgi:hypothetical protein